MSTGLIVGFAGTRQGPTPTQRKSMERLLSQLPLTGFVHGGGLHCDTIAHNIIRQAHPVASVDVYPNYLDRKSVLTVASYPFGGSVTIHLEPFPDHIREIVGRIHGLIAVPRTDVEDTTSNTWAAIRCALEIGCPVYMIRRSGEVVRHG